MFVKNFPRVIDQKDELNRTGFIWACIKGNKDVIENLININLNVTKQKDNHGFKGYNYCT